MSSINKSIIKEVADDVTSWLYRFPTIIQKQTFNDQLATLAKVSTVKLIAKNSSIDHKHPTCVVVLSKSSEGGTLTASERAIINRTDSIIRALELKYDYLKFSHTKRYNFCLQADFYQSDEQLVPTSV